MWVSVQACVCERVRSEAAEICEECNLASGCLTQPECSVGRRAHNSVYLGRPLKHGHALERPLDPDLNRDQQQQKQQQPQSEDEQQSHRLIHWVLGQHIVAPWPSLGKQLELHFKIARLMLMDLLGHEYLSRVQD